MLNPHILYCVLNWGLGHATRSIPVIRTFLEAGCTLEIASDGGPLRLLQKTFPEATTHALPGYHIHYPTRWLLINALSQMHKMIRAVPAERKAISYLLAKRHYDAIVSDNRYGCHHPSVPSVLITHQLSHVTSSPVLNKPGEWVIHGYMKHFPMIWVPDTPDHQLSGKMTVLKSDKIRFIGHLSDQKHHPLDRAYDVAAILSGPEPQRSYLEDEIRPQLLALSGKHALVRGVIEETAPEKNNNLIIYPYRDREGIGALLNSATVIVCRTGYSSLMDLLKVGTKAILIPTPGQPEQEYLGKQLQNHPQFVVQKQGKINIADGVRELRERPDVQIRERENILLGEAVQDLIRRL